MDLIASLLPGPKHPGTADENVDSDDDEDSETAELLRKTTLFLLRLTYTRALSRLESAEQEVTLLHSMPPPPSSRPQDDPRDAARKTEEEKWRLDRPVPSGGPDGRGPLMDASGKVCTYYHPYHLAE
jgi:immunoglobulin-binding protein 1